MREMQLVYDEQRMLAKQFEQPKSTNAVDKKVVEKIVEGTISKVCKELVAFDGTDLIGFKRSISEISTIVDDMRETVLISLKTNISGENLNPQIFDAIAMRTEELRKDEIKDFVSMYNNSAHNIVKEDVEYFMGLLFKTYERVDDLMAFTGSGRVKFSPLIELDGKCHVAMKRLDLTKRGHM